MKRRTVTAKVLIGASVLVISMLACGDGQTSQTTSKPTNELVEVGASELQDANTPTVKIEPSNTQTETSDPNEDYDWALETIQRALLNNQTSIQITEQDLKVKQNPIGEGFFVYVEETRFLGVERLIVWICVGGEVYANNGATKDITPDLPWPREAPADLWATTKLPVFSISDVNEFVFNEVEITPHVTDTPSFTPEPEVKFGYSIEERIEIYQDVVLAEDRAFAEGLEYDHYHQEIADEYGLSKEELEQILLEGLLNSWPLPEASDQ